jgi:hypothetical protein
MPGQDRQTTIFDVPGVNIDVSLVTLSPFKLKAFLPLYNRLWSILQNILLLHNCTCTYYSTATAVSASVNYNSACQPSVPVSSPSCGRRNRSSLLLRPILLFFRYSHHVVPYFSAYMCCSDSLKPIYK